MKKGLAWCGLFTGGALAAGGTVWAAIAAAAASKQEFISDAISEFTGNFYLPRFSFNASMAQGMPAMTMDFRNITGDAGQFLTPSMLNTIYSYADKAGEFTFAATIEQGGMFIVLALLVGANFIYLKNENANLKKEVERIREHANIPAADEEDSNSAYRLIAS